MTNVLDGKVALVTGAGSGIGYATAMELANQGAAVIAVDLKNAELACDAILKAGGNAIAVETDVSNESSVIDAVKTGLKEFERLDFSISCAGIISEAPLIETSIEDFDRVIAVNLRGTFLVGRETIRVMLKQGKAGRVINIASELAYLGRAKYSAYCASKGAVLTMTRSWAREFAPEILVNTVAPGPVDTPMLNAEDVSEEVFESESDIPIGRVGQPSEIASVVAFLCGPGATFMTGQAVSPNGGALMI